MVVVKFKRLVPEATQPTQANPSDAGFDIRAVVDTYIQPGGITKVPTGLSVEIPDGYELQVRSKSGMALKEGLVVAQGIGTIDSGYRGEVCVLLRNTQNFGKMVRASEMIAQLVLNELPKCEWKEVTELTETVRAEKGFGSTKEKEVVKPVVKK